MPRIDPLEGPWIQGHAWVERPKGSVRERIRRYRVDPTWKLLDALQSMGYAPIPADRQRRYVLRMLGLVAVARLRYSQWA